MRFLSIMKKKAKKVLNLLATQTSGKCPREARISASWWEFSQHNETDHDRFLARPI